MSISNFFESAVAEPLKELNAKLAEVEAAANFVTAAAVLRPRLGKIVSWERLQKYEKEIASDFIRQRDANSRTVFISLVVICYGSLEDFSREIVERAVGAINAAGDKVGTIPEAIFEENIYRTGQVLQSVRAKRTIRKYDFMELARNLGSCDMAGGLVTLNAECFSFEQGSASPDSIDSSLARVGVRLDWDRFGACSEIQNVLGESRTRDCANAAREAVENLVRTRNLVSHTGGLDIEVSEEDVLRYARFLPPFCGVLVKEVGKQLDALSG